MFNTTSDLFAILLARATGGGGGGGGGGTDDYRQLSHKPTINGVTVTGALTSADLQIVDANDATITVKVTGENDQTFTTNQSSASNITIPVPVKGATLNSVSFLNTTNHLLELVCDGTYDAATNKLATEYTVSTAITNLGAVVRKGTLGGLGADISTLPVDGSAAIGDMYKVVQAGTYASQAAKVGDIFICITKTSNANTWDYIPSGNDVTSVAVSKKGILTDLTNSDAITETGTISLALKSQSDAFAGAVAAVATTATTKIYPVALDKDGVLGVHVPWTDENLPTFDPNSDAYNASTNPAATVDTVVDAIAALDGGTIGTGSAAKTITSLSQADGNVSATFDDISIPVSQVNDVTSNTSIVGVASGTSKVTTELSTSAYSSTVPANAVADMYSYDSATNTLTINFLIAPTANTTTTTNVVKKTS